MSRCFPFPPPNYVRNGASGDALIGSIKLQRKKEKSKDERKKEKKREKKAKKEKDREKHGSEKSAIPNAKKLSDEVEPLEKSNITEEHGHPSLQHNASESSDSTHSSYKRKRESSPSEGHNQGNIIRIRLPSQRQKVTDVSVSREQVCSTSGRTSPASQPNTVPDVSVRKEQLCSTSGRTSPASQPKTVPDVSVSKEQVCSTLGRTSSASQPKTVSGTTQRYVSTCRNSNQGLIRTNHTLANEQTTQKQGSASEKSGDMIALEMLRMRHMGAAGIASETPQLGLACTQPNTVPDVSVSKEQARSTLGRTAASQPKTVSGTTQRHVSTCRNSNQGIIHTNHTLANEQTTQKQGPASEKSGHMIALDMLPMRHMGAAGIASETPQLGLACTQSDDVPQGRNTGESVPEVRLLAPDVGFASASKPRRKKHKTETPYEALFGSWVPPPLTMELGEFDESWLFETKTMRRDEDAIKSCKDSVVDGRCFRNTSMWPQAHYLPEADMLLHRRPVDEQLVCRRRVDEQLVRRRPVDEQLRRRRRPVDEWLVHSFQERHQWNVGSVPLQHL